MKVSRSIAEWPMECVNLSAHEIKLLITLFFNLGVLRKDINHMWHVSLEGSSLVNKRATFIITSPGS